MLIDLSHDLVHGMKTYRRTAGEGPTTMGESMRPDHVHGYSDRERTRLLDQATTLTELLRGDTSSTRWPRRPPERIERSRAALD